jgi:trigger factor
MNKEKIIIFWLLAVIVLGTVYFAAAESRGGNQETTTAETTEAATTSETPAIPSVFDENGFIANVTAKDYAGVFDYKNIKIPKDKHLVTEEMLTAEINSMIESFTDAVPVYDRAVKDGDSVNIDFVGTIDGVPFEGGDTQGNGYNVIAGSSDFIGEFLTKIIGLSPGDSIDITETFPNDYTKEDLRGKEAVFATTVNYINELPELTDSFVSEHLQADHGWKTVEEARAGLTEYLTEELVYNYITEQIYAYIDEKIDFENLPAELIEYYEQSMISYFTDMAVSYSMTLNDFLSSQVGVNSKEELIEYYKDFNRESAAYSLVMQAVAEDAGIQVTDADIDEYLLEYPESAEEDRLFLKNALMNDKVTEMLTDGAVLE